MASLEARIGFGLIGVIRKVLGSVPTMPQPWSGMCLVSLQLAQ